MLYAEDMGLVFNNYVSSRLMLVSGIQHTVRCTGLSVFLVRVYEGRGITACSTFLPMLFKEVLFPIH